MKKENLKAKEIYTFYFGRDTENVYITRIKRNGDNELGNYLYTINGMNKYYKNPDGHTMNTAINNCRLATNEEIQWLLACEKANKFVPRAEVIVTIETLEIF